MIQAMLPSLQRVLLAARQRAACRPFPRRQPERMAAAFGAVGLANTRDGKSPDYTLDGTWGHQFVAGFEPMEGEPVVRKHRSSKASSSPRSTPSCAARDHLGADRRGGHLKGCVESTARCAVS
ncbi:MAG: hypothetical protein U0556_17875 [Dehalococcoidia bacterium]